MAETWMLWDEVQEMCSLLQKLLDGQSRPSGQRLRPRERLEGRKVRMPRLLKTEDYPHFLVSLKTEWHWISFCFFTEDLFELIVQ